MTNQKKQPHSSLEAQEGLQVLDEQDLAEVTGGGLSDNPLAKKLFPNETQPLLSPLDQAVTKWREERPGVAWQDTYKKPPADTIKVILKK